MNDSISFTPLERNIFTNRTLNMRSIQAIGYDMDYTLIHYNVKRWEQAMYEYLKRKLLELGWPVENLEHIPGIIIRGLVIDKKFGNIVKPNRFGYVKRAFHGTKPLEFGAMRKVYSRTTVDIREDRWLLLTTLFDIPVACMYSQLVDKLDRYEFPEVMGYADLAELLIGNLDAAYAEGMLKDEILKDPARYVVEDPDTFLTLLDQKHAGKKLLLITNSEWEFVSGIMAYTFDSQLQNEMTWRDLFDMIIVSAEKPNFFLREQPVFEVVTEEGLLRPVTGSLKEGAVYVGGHAKLVEEAFGLKGSQIMYIGDHVESDVHVSKSILRWRTGLVLRELEEELACLCEFQDRQAELTSMMGKKVTLEQEHARLKLHTQRIKGGYGPETKLVIDEINSQVSEVEQKILTLDERIKPLAKKAQEIFNPHWGLLTRAGFDKSYLARQLEGYADIYTSRVSNLIYQTPFAYLRSTRSSLPHDGGIIGGPHEWKRQL
ncbi:MAG: HAD-IG family 5'-nucleotidase [Desulfobacterales bacterium]